MDRRYKMAPEKRTIGGKSYKYLEWRKLKRDAENHADSLRKKYSSVRVAKAASGYAIYVR